MGEPQSPIPDSQLLLRLLQLSNLSPNHIELEKPLPHCRLAPNNPLNAPTYILRLRIPKPTTESKTESVSKMIAVEYCEVKPTKSQQELSS